MSKLSSINLTPSEINAATRDEMFQLYARYYDGATAASFLSDLDAKDYVLLLKDEEGHVQGFSTLEHDSINFEGKLSYIAFSGDTIINKKHWGTPILPLEWCSLAGKLKAMNPDAPLYWLLICKGYRTYRYLPLFTHEFSPRYDKETPKETARFINHIATKRFGKAWNAETGILEFSGRHDSLKKEIQEAKEGLMRKPHIRYFFEANPAHYKGDELVCLTELSPKNMRGIAQRSFVKSYKTYQESAKGEAII